MPENLINWCVTQLNKPEILQQMLIQLYEENEKLKEELKLCQKHLNGQ